MARRRASRRGIVLGALVAGILAAPGCHTIPIAGKIDANADVRAGITGKVEVQIPPVADPGPIVPVVIRPGGAGPGRSPRVALIDVDGLLVNQNQTGLLSAGENPVGSFREKLEAAACDARVRAVVVRINSPGGGVAASDVMAEELRRFRQHSGKPAVACLLDTATGGAYYLAIGCDRVVALPTTVTGAIGALVNHANLQEAMAQLNVELDTVKSAELVDMGAVTAPLPDKARVIFQDMADGFGRQFAARLARQRPTMTPADLKVVSDGRIVAAPKAVGLHMVDSLGYPDDAIDEAARLAGMAAPEVVLLQRPGYPARSVYASVPNVPLQSELIPFSYPGLERSKLPTFLYLWQPDPTLSRLGGR